MHPQGMGAKTVTISIIEGAKGALSTAMVSRTGNNNLDSPALRRLSRIRSRRGLALVEAMVACAIIAFTFAGVMYSMTIVNRRAILSRIQTNARAVVQRNIDRALSEKFTIQISPSILATTTTSGSTWDDDGGGDNKVSVVTENSTGTIVIPGTLTRTVTSITNTAGAELRQVTFSLAYSWRGNNYTYKASTTRSRD
jgi:type II secretory pathway pseudopilin PulG